MSHVFPEHKKRRALLIGLVGVAALTTALTAAALATGSKTSGSAQVIACPSPVNAIPAVPPGAQAEVTRNLGELDKQIAEANKRLVDTVGQGGANFVQNAILGPLEDKRTAVLNRIETAIGRQAAKPEGLEKFARCALAAPGQAAPAPATTTSGAAAGTPATGVRTVACPTPVIPDVPAGAQAEVTRNLGELDKQIAEANKRLVDTVGQGGANFAENAIVGPLEDKRTAVLNRIETAIGRLAAKPEGLEKFARCELADAGQAAPAESSTSAAAPASSTAPAAGGGGAIACPSPVDAIPAVPAGAQAEVTRELANLDNQIAEANKRLVDTAGQGGANFVQNAILGPLEDKRVAALNRIETAIGRLAAKPEGLEKFAPCALRQ
jgi:TolA-binding protein